MTHGIGDTRAAKRAAVAVLHAGVLATERAGDGEGAGDESGWITTAGFGCIFYFVCKCGYGCWRVPFARGVSGPGVFGYMCSATVVCAFVSTSSCVGGLRVDVCTSARVQCTLYIAGGGEVYSHVMGRCVSR